jgi:hypothetical protein
MKDTNSSVATVTKGGTGTGESVRTRPVIFSSPMIRALLDGRKTQTRRVIKPQPPDDYGPVACEVYHPAKADRQGELVPGDAVFGFADEDQGWPCPYGRPGDQLWCRETWASDERGRVAYRASEETWPTHAKVKDGSGWVSWAWRPSIHMPQWASRITLEITGVRVERAHQITEADVLAEGVDPAAVDKFRKWFHPDDVHALAFGELWEGIHGPGSWARNPWVWCLSFRRVEPR